MIIWRLETTQVQTLEGTWKRFRPHHCLPLFPGFYRARFYSKDATVTLVLDFYSWYFLLQELFAVADKLAGCEDRL